MAAEDRDTIIVNDCNCGCGCGEVEIHSDHQPEVLLLDEFDDLPANQIDLILQIVQSLQVDVGGTNIINNITNNMSGVVPVLTYGTTAPEFPKEGDHYINSTTNVLYVYGESGWAADTPTIESIYTSVDTSHIYLWNGTRFVDVTTRITENIFYGSKKKPCLEAAFLNDLYVTNGDSENNGGKIVIRDKNNAIEDTDYIILYYWDRKKHRISAFAGGTGDKKIYPAQWKSMESTSKRKQKGWKDDWRVLPYTMADIMQRITYMTPEQYRDLTWVGGYKKGTLLGSMSFVGGPRGNGYCTKLWIGVARKVSFINNTTKYTHFSIDDLMDRTQFYLRSYHVPSSESESWTKIQVNADGDLSYNVSFSGNMNVIVERDGTQIRSFSMSQQQSGTNYTISDLKANDIVILTKATAFRGRDNNVKGISTGSILGELRVVDNTNIKTLDFTNAVAGTIASGVSFDMVRTKPTTLYCNAKYITTYSLVHTFLQNTNNVGTVYLDSTGEYYQTLVNDATAKGWTILPLPKQTPASSSYYYTKGHVRYIGSQHRKPHINFKQELSTW